MINLNEEYKLKKDLPNVKAGEIFIVKKDEHAYYLVLINKLSIPTYQIENFKEWFEKVPLIPQYQNDMLWVEIGNNSFEEPLKVPCIELPKLRSILEKYKILDDEKDGM